MSAPPESAGREILSLLLDKYEKSVFAKTGARPSRRIKIRLYDAGLSDYRPYNIEDTLGRQTINRALSRLADKNLVYLRWMKGQENFIIAQVSLNTDTAEAIDAAYLFLGRKPKKTMAGEISREAEELLETIQSPWMRRFLEENQALLSRRGAPGGQIPGDKAERQNLFRALRFIDEQAEKSEILERVFSVRCFGNSKTFETSVKKRLLDIIRRYSDCEDDSTAEELLAFAGIVRYPEGFEFRGPLVIHFEAPPHSPGAARGLDFSPLRYGASFSSPDFKRGRLTLPPGLTRLLSIENKANYVSYLRQNPDETELVVYHGGQFSPARGAFFRALAAAMPVGCLWYHWGDIDYGGFSMLSRLRREVHPEVRPYRMDARELVKYAGRAMAVTKTYAAKLLTLSRDETLADCRPCIKYMLDNAVRLEQEVMLENEAPLSKDPA
jgi:DNA-binding transcriptional ArsR family regulator